MKNLKSLIAATLFITVFISCSKNNCIDGSGDYVSRNYNVASFNGISVSGEADVFITIDSIQSVRIEAQNNIHGLLDIKVEGKRLSVGFENNTCVRNTKPLQVYISTPTLTEIVTSGSVDVTNSGTIDEGELNLKLSGVGTMNLNCNVQEFNANVSGDANIKASGTATDQSLNSSGEAYFQCFDLVGENVDIDVSGSADLEVHATKTLDIDVSGSANIYYKGNPTITQNISGSVTITDAN